MRFDFLWHLRGSLPIAPGTSNPAVMASVQDMLLRHYKMIDEMSDDFISFDDRIWIKLGVTDFRKFGWSPMQGYDRGLVWIEENPLGRSLRYDFRSLHGFLYCVFVSALFGGIIGLTDETSFAWSVGVGLFVLFYGIHLLRTFWVPSAFRSALKDGPHP